MSQAYNLGLSLVKGFLCADASGFLLLVDFHSPNQMGSSLLITRLLPIGGCLSLPYAPRKGRLEVSLPHSARHAQPSVSRLRICARSRDTTDPETHRLTLKQQFLASLNVSDLSYQVVGWSYFAYCVASAFVSLAIFQQLQEAIADTAIATGYKVHCLIKSRLCILTMP